MSRLRGYRAWFFIKIGKNAEGIRRAKVLDRMVAAAQSSGGLSHELMDRLLDAREDIIYGSIRQDSWLALHELSEIAERRAKNFPLPCLELFRRLLDSMWSESQLTA